MTCLSRVRAGCTASVAYHYNCHREIRTPVEQREFVILPLSRFHLHPRAGCIHGTTHTYILETCRYSVLHSPWCSHLVYRYSFRCRLTQDAKVQQCGLVSTRSCNMSDLDIEFATRHALPLFTRRASQANKATTLLSVKSSTRCPGKPSGSWWVAWSGLPPPPALTAAAASRVLSRNHRMSRRR